MCYLFKASALLVCIVANYYMLIKYFAALLNLFIDSQTFTFTEEPKETFTYEIKSTENRVISFFVFVFFFIPFIFFLSD